LCHAIGPLRPRVLISASLVEQLDPIDLRCALEHETAHLRRRDPLAHFLLSVASLFALPVWAAALSRAYRSAAEQACDDAAAHVVSDGALVATALLKVAGLQSGVSSTTPALGAFGFGEHPLEARVRRLLSNEVFDVRRARGLQLAGWVAAGTLAFAMLQASFVHHAVETALHIAF
jgi:beta-lactamase regulating signal transducer with metallopeptidase domain